MMKKRVVLMLFIAVVGLFVFSCKDDSAKPKALSTDDAKVEIDNTSKDIAGFVDAIDQGDAMQAITNFIDLARKSFRKDGDKEWFEDMIISLEDQFDMEALANAIEEGDQFNFVEHAAKYSWNFDTEEWDKSESSSIIFEFPATSGSTTNNAVVTFESYTDALVTIEGEGGYLPTSLHFKVEVDNETIIAVDLIEAEYENAIPYISKVDFYLLFSPVSTSLKYNKVSQREFDFQKTLSDGVNNVGISSNIKLLKDLDDYVDETYLEQITGKAFVNDLSVRYNFNLKNIASYEDEPDENQLNGDFNVDIYHKEQKIGYLLLENEEVYVVYNDGQKELFEDAFSEFIDALENIGDGFDDMDLKKMSLKRKYKLFKKSRDFKNTINFLKRFK